MLKAYLYALYINIFSNDDYHGKALKDIQLWYCKEFKEMLLQVKNKEVKCYIDVLIIQEEEVEINVTTSGNFLCSEN